MRPPHWLGSERILVASPNGVSCAGMGRLVDRAAQDSATTAAMMRNRKCTYACLIPFAEVLAVRIGGTACATYDVRNVGHHVDDQMSLFSAISIASSTSMPR